jgi:tetratricopeptide (TPR) repeat protein
VGERVAEDAWSLLVQGGCLLMMRDHEGAIATLEQALRADPNSSRAHGLLALALALAGRHDDALAEAAAADRLSPSDLRGVVWHNATAVSHFARRDYARALAAGQRIAALHPDYVVGHRIVAASAARLGQPEVAAAAVREVLRIMPGVGMRTAIASVPYRERAEAEDYLAALIEAGLPA